jgi:hypothetical protein
MRFAIAIMVIGGVVAFLGFQEWQLASVAKADPQTISCADLSEKGYGDNAHVRLTNFIMSPGTYVYKADAKAPSKPWETVWVPLVPEGGEYHQMVEKIVKEKGENADIPMPTNIRVILKSKKIANETSLGSAMEAPEIDGIVVNKIESLGSKEKDILKSSYAGIDFDKCWIVEHARTPAGTPQIMGMMGGGLAAVVIPGLFLLGALRKKNT